jgi:hypothetical protein
LLYSISLHITHNKLINIQQASLVKDPAVSVNRIIWSPDGTLFGKMRWFNQCFCCPFDGFNSDVFIILIGVAYSRHIVQIYSYNGGDDIRQHLEVWLHVS